MRNFTVLMSFQHVYNEAGGTALYFNKNLLANGSSIVNRYEGWVQNYLDSKFLDYGISLKKRIFWTRHSPSSGILSKLNTHQN